ncbi:lasso peptide biosynthesis B2 protein [Actinokineospora iranica]|uniref:Transglutaminase-like superfamily protein n=1 Tax=Actinokineospora iranica TaxID=1271860 RepID=A0A1G6VYT9_9PSEU|nr:lasso peptide biosynthesis B2 protein [Actinokineospora iranica]SDD57945.1 Transglutaminase-like superfamily protein [Actinokineospora iranica]
MDLSAENAGSSVTYLYVTAPSDIAACDLGADTATVLVNYRTGDVHTLTDESARWWAELSTTGNPASTSVLDSQSASRLVNQLRAAGLLTGTTQPCPWPAPIPGKPWRLSFGTQESQAGRAPLPHVRVRALAGGALAVAVVLLTRHIGRRSTSMARLLRLLTWAHHLGNHPATPVQAEQAVNAVRRVCLLVPGRAACLEESTAAVLLLAAYRLQVTWCHGVAADPIRLHAWVETDHGPVSEPASTTRYTPLRTIPNRTKGDHDHQPER